MFPGGNPPIFAGWQDVAQQTRVQKTLELQLAQREDAETQLSSGRKEMQRLQVPYSTKKGSAGMHSDTKCQLKISLKI